jgi:hypothetical protein
VLEEILKEMNRSFSQIIEFKCEDNDQLRDRVIKKFDRDFINDNT